MAKEIIGASVEVEYKSIGEMRKAIKEATGDVIRMQQQFGNTSKEAMEAAKRVALLKDRVKEASEVTQLFDPGNKFKALGNTIQVAAGGFAALQGAMGLFGVKSEEVEKQLLKVQSALALSQGLSTVADGAKEFGRLASMIKGPVVAAFTTLRGALMATGIGLITGAIAYLVTNFEKVKKVIYDTFPSLKGLFDNFDRIKQIAYGVGNAILQFIVSPVKALVKLLKGDFQGAMAEIKAGASFTKNFREGESNEIKSQQEEKDKARQEELAKQREANAAKLAEQRKQWAAEAAQRKQERERRLKEIEDEERAALILKWKYENEKALLLKSVRDQLKVDETFGREERRIAEDEEYFKWLEKRKKDQDSEKQSQLDYNAALINAEIDLQGAKYEAASAGFFLLSALAGKNQALQNTLFILDRALAIAKVVIDTQKEVAGYYSNPTWTLMPDGGAAIKTAMSLKAKIRAGISIATIAGTTIQKFMSGSGANLSSPGGSSFSAPLQPALSPQAQSTALNSAAINNIGNKAIQAYILNSDLQSNEQINAILQRNASLG